MERGEIDAKLDWVDKVIVANTVDERQALFMKTLQTGSRRIETRCRSSVTRPGRRLRTLGTGEPCSDEALDQGFSTRRYADDGKWLPPPARTSPSSSS